MTAGEEIHASELRLIVEMEAKLSETVGALDRQMVREVYHDLMKAERDIIGQRHGFTPLQWQIDPPSIRDRALWKLEASK